MPNPFVHVELNTTNIDMAKNFYGKLFGWKLEDMPMGPMTYTMIQVGKDSGGVGGGMMKQMHPGAPTIWLSYVLVDDIREATKKAKSLGATIAQDVTDVADMGTMSIIVDPTGGHLGLWQPKKAA
jgi:predicted enzyme related to lactoylglutathione lyase